MRMQKHVIALPIILALAACGGSGDGSDNGGNNGGGNTNTSATFSGSLTSSIDADTSSVSGNVSVTDPDSGEATITAQANTATSYATFSINSAGDWTYTLDTNNSDVVALADGDTLSDSISIESADGTSTNVEITITGVNDTPSFGSGNLVNAASIEKTDSDPINGTLSVTDPDNDESAFTPQSSIMTSYGMFSIAAAGTWEYTLDTSNATVSALASPSDTLTDSITVTTVDGTSTTIDITITGVAATASNFIRGSIGDNDTVPDVNCDTVYNSLSALEDAVSFDMTPGVTLCLASGTYTGDFDLKFGGAGTEDMPITVAAEVPGTVTITGDTFVGLTGTYAVLQGFIFKDGEMSSSVLQTRANSNTACNYCRVTENSFIDMDDGQTNSTKWLQIYGANNRIDHNWFSGKTTAGAWMVIERGDSPGTEDRTQIDHNYFGDRPPKEGAAYGENSDNEYEGIRVGTSSTHTSDSFAVIEHNFFEGIDGEAEVISIKAGGVTVRHNTIRNSRGSIVSRHGEGSVIENNFIIGDGNPFAGGIRLVDANHSVTNNYIEGSRFPSSSFYGGILISNSDGSTGSGYQDVENVFVAHNTIVDSANSINFAAGSRDDSPEDVYFINNIVDDAVGDVITNADSLPNGYVFAGNIVHGRALADDDSVTSLTGFSFVDPSLSDDGQGLARPSDNSPDLSADLSADTGSYSFPTTDMDGQTRTSATLIGADETSDEEVAAIDFRGLLTKDLVGPLNYTPPSSVHRIQVVSINNADFDSGDLTGWTNTEAQYVSDDEAFSKNSSVEVFGASGEVSQTVAVEENTNYTLSAFVKGDASISATLGSDVYNVDESSSKYTFTTVSFNSGSNTSVEISGQLASEVDTYVDILNADFDDDQDNWVVNEGTGIGQVQDSSNSASGADGSIKFVYNDVDDGTPYDPYIAQTITVTPNTDYTLGMYILNKNTNDSTVLFGVHTGSAVVDGVFDSADILASKNSVYDDLSEDDEGDDSFRPDTLTFNSGANTTLTIFAQFQSSTGAEIRVDDFSLFSTGAPDSSASASFDEFRLVSHPSLP